MDRIAFVTKLCAALERPPGSLTERTPLHSESLDSIELLNVIALIDEDAGLTVSGDDLKRCRSVGELLTFLEQAPREQTG